MIEKLNIIAKALNERSGRGGTGSASITDVTYAGQLDPNENSGIIARVGNKIYMPIKTDADGYKVIFNKNKSTSQQCGGYILNDIIEQLPRCSNASSGENRACFNEFSNKTWYACRGSENGGYTNINICADSSAIESCSKIKFLVSNFFSINNITNLIPADYHSTIIKLLVDGNEVDSVEFPHITKDASVDDIVFQYLTFDAVELDHCYNFEFIVEDLEPDGNKAETRFNIFEMIIEKEGAESTFSWSEMAQKKDTKKELNDLKADVKAETSDIRSEITTTNERIEEVDKRIEDTRILLFNTLPDPGEIYLDRVIKVGTTLYLCKKTGEGVTKFYPFDDFVARTSEYTDRTQFSKTIGNNFYTDFEATANHDFTKVFPDDGGFHLGSSKATGTVTFVPKHQFDMPVTKFCAYVQSWSDTKNSGVRYGYNDNRGDHVFDEQKIVTPGEVHKIEIKGFCNYEDTPSYSFYSFRPDKIDNVSGDFRVKFVNGFEVTFGETTYEWIPVGGSKLIEVTYDELKNLRNNAKLIPGQQYRITDYKTITVQEGTKSAGHRFDIIVTADDEKTLNENARACKNKGELEEKYSYVLYTWGLSNYLDESPYYLTGQKVIDGIKYYEWRKFEINTEVRFNTEKKLYNNAFTCGYTKEIPINASVDNPCYFDIYIQFGNKYLERTDKRLIEKCERIKTKNGYLSETINGVDYYKFAILTSGNNDIKVNNADQFLFEGIPFNVSEEVFNIIPVFALFKDIPNNTTPDILLNTDNNVTTERYTDKSGQWTSVENMPFGMCTYQYCNDSYGQIDYGTTGVCFKLLTFQDLIPDPYFDSCNLAAWELKYCLDNDMDRFAWANEDAYTKSICVDYTPSETFTRYNQGDGRGVEGLYCWKSKTGCCIWTKELFVKEGESVEFGYDDTQPGCNALVTKFEAFNSGKGVIYYMKDEWGNECPYDFKNIMFQRYFDENDNCYKYDPNSSTNRWCYTFCMWDFYDNQPHDLSVDQFKYKDDNYWEIAHTKNNIIKSNIDIINNINRQVIANIAFVTNTNISNITSDYINGSFHGFYNNKISGESGDVTFSGTSILNNIITNVQNSTMANIYRSTINTIRGMYINEVDEQFWFNNQKRF